MWKNDHSLETLVLKWTLGSAFVIVTAVFILKILIVVFTYGGAKLAILWKGSKLAKLIHLLK